MKEPKLTVVVLTAIAVCVGLVSFSPGGVLASGTTYYVYGQNGNDASSGPVSAPLLSTPYSLTFSTLLGGAGEDVARGVDVDVQGNIYVTGNTNSPTFPITEGTAYQNNGAQCGSLGSFGKKDSFVSKFSPSGQLIWSRLIDTPCYSHPYAVHVDSAGYVYLAGQTGDHFATTAGVIQPVFPGSITNPSAKYGAQSPFVAKLSSDGSQIIWATYFGGNDHSLIRDMTLDPAGNIFIGVGDVTAPNPFITQGAFQSGLGGGTDLIAAKISNDGTSVIWATYFGGSADDGIGPSVRIDSLDEPIYFASTKSTNLPVTAGAYQSTFAGTVDGYLVKFTADGRGLVFSTYIGGSGEESTETHHLTLDSQGNAFVSTYTNSTNFPTTVGAYQRTLGGDYDFGLAKFSPTGSLLAATYFGGTGAESPQGVSIDSLGNPVFFGSSASSNICSGGVDELIVKFDPNLGQVLVLKCIGGSLIDQARDGVVDSQGNLIAVGWTQSTDFPLVNPIQSTLGGGYDATILKLALSGSSSNTPTAAVTPTSTSTVTAIPLTPTLTYTATATDTPVPPSATPTNSATATSTPVSPSPTPTDSATATDTPVPPSATATETETPTITPTETVPPTDPPPTMITVQENDPRAQYDAWLGVSDQGASGGTYRVSKVANDTARFTFKGTSVQWISKRGPDQGLASVTIDGVSKGFVDLYNATTQYQWSKRFGTLPNQRHTITIKVLGAKNPYSTGANVVIDAFVAGGTIFEDDDSAIRFDNWQSRSNVSSSGGTYRLSSSAGSINKFTFSGTEVEWVTAKGPSYGKANVFVDNLRIGGTLDLYSRTQQWQVVISFTGLAPGPHTIEIRPLGSKNPASNGKGIVIDAFCTAATSP